MFHFSNASSLVLAASLTLGAPLMMAYADQPAVKADAGAQPKVGDKAADFSLSTLEGKNIELSKLLAEGPVVLVVLRGWPGYQCPLCTAQVGDLINKGDEFKSHKARIVLVYPGPAEKLGDHAKEFASGKNFKANFTLVTDPGYKFTSAYNLRWDKPSETAYPSTFVIDSAGVIRYAKISKSHGDRAPSAEILKALAAIK